MKKVLVITYHWPPSGGITVLRCLKLVKYFRENGWEPVVFTAENASYQYLDFTNKKDIPENIEILKVPIFEPINLFKKITGRKKSAPIQNITSNSEKKKSVIDKLSMWIRGNFFIPDARSKWIKPSLKYLDQYLQENQIDAIFTDGPPHTNTVIGLRLSQRHNIPWLADFQDPWTQVDYYAKLYIGKRADLKHKKLEQEVFRVASKITIASPTWKKELEDIGAKNVGVFYYGYDEDDFLEYSKKKTDEFVIFHAGLLGEDRNPDTLFKCIKQIIESNELFKSKIKISLAGEVDFSVRHSISEHGLDEFTEYLGMIPRSSVISKYATSSLLLLPINKAGNARGRIPGKLFELLRSHKRILVLGPNESDVKTIVESKKSGASFEYTDDKGLLSFILDSFEDSQTENSQVREDISEFSNKFLTRKISQFLNEITDD